MACVVTIHAATMTESSFLATLRRLLCGIADLVAPRACEVCHSRLALSEQYFCIACRMVIPRTGDFLEPYDNITVRKLWGRVDVERGAAFAEYTPHVGIANAIYAMKYGGRFDIAEEFGKMIASETVGSGFFDGIDLILPMPLHKHRERQRGYNQSAEIAYGLRKITHIPVCLDAVKRVRNTMSQATLDMYSRVSNMDGAFSLVRPERVAGKHVLLVDDIITTGASMTALAQEVIKAPGTSVSFLTIGRTSD